MTTYNGNINAEYENSIKEKRKFDNLIISRSSDEYKEQFNKVLEILLSCRRTVDRQALFSANEDLDDIATSDLQYLSVDYHLANLLEKGGDNFRPRFLRLDFVNQALGYYVNYLKMLSNYNVLPKQLSSKVQQAIKTTSEGEEIDLSKLETSNPAAKRAEKIEWYKLEKKLEAVLADRVSNDDEPDEATRQAQLAQMGLFALKTLSALSTLSMEKQLLSHRPSEDQRDEINRQRNLLDPAHQRRLQSVNPEDQFTTRIEELQNTKPLLSTGGKVNRPFTIVSSRDQIKKNVFGIGQQLPTMTVDEYLQEELKRGGIIEGGGEASRTDPDAAKEDEDDNDKADAATYEAREWDEFAEDNPRGSGNTMNMG